MVGLQTALYNSSFVFKKWQYVLLGLLIGILFYSFNALIINLDILSFMYGLSFWQGLKFTATLIWGFSTTIETHSTISLLILSILLGALFSMIIYKAHMVTKKSSEKKTSILASVGATLAALAPGCAVCGIGLFSLLGISTAFLVSLPLEGLELSIGAIGILVYSNYSFAKNLFICKHSPKDNEKMSMERNKSAYVNLS